MPLEHSTLSGAQQGKVRLRMSACNFDKLDIRFLIANHGERSAYLHPCKEGDLIFQEFWKSINEKIFFDINVNGELIAIFPKGYDGFINEQGKLVIVKGTAEQITDGIGFMEIPITFEVQ